MRRFLGNVLVSLGVFSLLLSIFLYWQRVTPKRLSFDIKELGGVNNLKSNFIPTALAIPDLEIYLPIYPALVTNGRWEATFKGVSYLTSTPIPGQIGNSVFYGHNWKSLLGNLTKAKPGQKIEIYFSDGRALIFKITHTQIVAPSQTKILEQTEDRRITLYTCSGFLDRKRFVVTAILQDNYLGAGF